MAMVFDMKVHVLSHAHAHLKQLRPLGTVFSFPLPLVADVNGLGTNQVGANFRGTYASICWSGPLTGSDTGTWAVFRHDTQL
eukprot:1131472-Amphidinium_carterae.1